MRAMLAVILTTLISVPATAAPPRIAGCQVFPAENVWNTPVDTLPVHASSATWVTTIGATANLHPDFGTFYLGAPIGIPFTTVAGSQAPVAIAFSQPGESDPGPYPIPPNAPIEGGSASTGDRHVLVLERDSCSLYELFSAYPQSNGSWQAYSGAWFDLDSNAMRPDTWTSADAAGLPILPGLLRYEEFAAGEINHAIRFTAPQTRKAHVWPARHDASSLTGTQYPPMGARFRLKAAFDISAYPAQIQVVLRALKKYGMILADNGSAWYISGEHNPLWNDDLLGRLKALKGSDFEAVETSAMVISPDSAKAFTPPPAVTLRQVASGLSSPVEITNAGDGSGRLFIAEKGGAIKILKNGAVLATPFLNVSGLTTTSGERGLLGLAFHPQFATNRRFFVFYTQAADGALRVSSFLANAANPDVADLSSEQEVITIPHPGADNHNGGHIAFGPDGFLYIGTGDGGGGGDPSNNAQTLSTLLGKLLRLDVSAAAGYAIPPGNPFIGTAGARAEIWAYGLRNPWKFSFDRATGDLYIGDVGQGAIEEINFVPNGAPGGRNFGWRVYEGASCYSPPTGCSLANGSLPVLQYQHNAAGGKSVTGGFVYRGTKSSALRGYYLYGDFISNRVWASLHEGNSWTTFELIAPPSLVSGLSSFGEDESGEIYLVNYNNGRVYAIDGPAPGIQNRGDVDGDGKRDILWRNSVGGDVYAWLMNGTSFSAFPLAAVPLEWSIVGSADINNDGRADILWRNTTTGLVYVWLMNGSAFTAALIDSVPLNWQIVGFNDFDGDGRADILWRETTTGEVYVWFMNGTTLLQARSLGVIPLNFSIVATGDTNGDGRSDILWRETATGAVYLWLMNGATFTPTYLDTVGLNWQIVGLADFNGDSRADIVWRETGSGLVYLWYLNGPTLTQALPLAAVPLEWEIKGLGNYDADPRADILWRNSSTGQIYLWATTGLGTFASQSVSTIPTAWNITGP